MKYKPILILLLIVFASGCSTFTITKDELVLQLKENQNQKEITQYIPAGGIASLFLSDKFTSNRIEKILCYNPEGKKVYLYPDQNTELEITKKSNGDVVKMYFDTAFLIENKIVGLRSRIIQTMIREVDIDDIEKIEIYVELPKTEPYVE